MTRAARRAWFVGGSLLTALALGSVLLQTIGVLARTTDDVRVRQRVEGAVELVVEVDGGSVEVRGTDRDEIVVTGTVTSGITSTRHSERLEGDRFVVRAECTGGPLSTFCAVDHVIDVPAGTAVTVRSSDTSVTLDRLRGPVDVDTSNEGVEATDLSGTEVVLSTSNADVVVRGSSATSTSATTSNAAVDLSFTAAVRRVAAHTSNGAVRIELPDTPEAYRVELDTSDGSASADVRTDPESERRISARTSNDDIVVRYPTTN